MAVQGKRSAIIVGVSKYEKAELTDLRYTTSDARRLASVLEKYCGFRSEDIQLFCDDDDPADAAHPSRLATFADVHAATEDVSKKATGDDLVLFFFAGHGNEISGEPYLLTNDTRLNVISETAISVHTINKYLEASQASAKIRVFDACRAGFGTRDLGLHLMKRGFADALLETPKATVTLCSCCSGEWAMEHQDLEQGLFSYYLCEGLAGAAADQDGNVTLERLADYVKTSVANWCKHHTHKQTPQLACNIEGTLTLAHVPSAPPHKRDDAEEASPLARLQRTYDERLAATPDDLRDAQPTSPAEAAQVSDLVRAILEEQQEQHANPHVVLDLSAPKRIRQFGEMSYRPFGEALTSSGLRPQFLDEVAFQLDFRSAKIALPSHKLTICIARCSFCYWVWCFDTLLVPELDVKSWRPKAASVSESFTVLPPAARNRDKMASLIGSIFQWATDTTEQWSREITAYLDEQMETVRQSGRIIK